MDDTTKDDLVKVERLDTLEKLNEFFYERAHLKKCIPTPKEQTDKKGEFTVAKWSYMLEFMDRYHSRRAEKFALPTTFIPQIHGFLTCVEVTDINTGEVRIGTDIGVIPAYEKDSDVLKSPKSIALLAGNAAKASLTLALRNAYSNFGAAADLYESVPEEPPSADQVKRWEAINELFQQKLADVPQLSTWWNSVKESWGRQFANTATSFLDDLEERVDNYIKRREKK